MKRLTKIVELIWLRSEEESIRGYMADGDWAIYVPKYIAMKAAARDFRFSFRSEGETIIGVLYHCEPLLPHNPLDRKVA